MWIHYSGKAFIHKWDKEGESCFGSVVEDFHWEQYTKTRWHKPVKRNYFDNGGEAFSQEQQHIVHQISLEMDKWSTDSGGKCEWFY